MVTVQIIGGLGNQLSAYACAYSIAKERGDELVLDVSDYYNGYFRPYVLDLLNIPTHRKVSYTFATANALTPDVMPMNLKDQFDAIIYESDGIKTREELVCRIGSAKNIYISGYFGDPNFYAPHKDEIYKMFQPLNPSNTLIQFKENIKSQESVAIHIRRTDFVVLNSETDITYFNAAIQYLKASIPNCIFYFFSDDIEFVRNTFGNRAEYRFVQIFGGLDADVDEFFCISECNHRILSQKSSFGAWAHTINTNSDKLDLMYLKSGELRNEEYIYIDDTLIMELNKKADKFSLGTSLDIKKIKSKVFEAIIENHYDIALKYINDISFHSYGITALDCKELATNKGIIYAQIGSFENAHQCFYKQLQYNPKDEDFYYNYALVLKQMGKIVLSALYAGLAFKISEDREVDKEFRGYYTGDSLLVYDLVSKVQKRHFIIAPILSWSFYHHSIISIAILLARMGHKVSFINSTIDGTVDKDTNNQIIAEFMMKSSIKLESVYDFNIQGYKYLNDISKTPPINYQQLLIEELINLTNYKTTIIARKPAVFQNKCVKPNTQYVFWDFCELADIESIVAKQIYDEEGLKFMYRAADIVATTEPKPDYKCHTINHYLQKENTIEYIDKRIEIPANYIDTDEMIVLAAKFLEI